MLTARKIQAKERKAYQEASFDWTNNMQVCIEQMLTPEEKEALFQWDKNRPDGAASSDWPGFEKYIGKPPHKQNGKVGQRAKLVSIR